MARMRDAFVVRDQNGINEMIPSQKERPMAMGDGTFMSDNAFKESIPMMSYTPEESKRIYEVLLEEWEYSKKRSDLLNRIHLGGYQ